MSYFGFFKARLKQVRKLSDYSADQRNDAQSLYLEALALDEKQDNECAILGYTRAIKVVPIFWEALDNRGLCHMRLHDFSSAIESFEVSAQVNPDSPLALVALIKCYRETQQNVNAMHVADFFTKKWPGKSPFPDWNKVLGVAV
jgi:tetratricopeptide (TPR) repeat protein